VTAPPPFEHVYAECHRQVYALCRNVLGNRADAEDGMQETFLAVARALPKFRNDSSVTTWVHRIAIRCAMRRAASRRPFEPLDIDPPDDAVDDPVATRDSSARMARAMASLSLDHRLVISLFAIDGLTHAEIAEDLGVPEGTVWSRLHTAKKKLAAALSE
jgi:RNA polymerase sigma-70 factor (ECF subfamily)